MDDDTDLFENAQVSENKKTIFLCKRLSFLYYHFYSIYSNCWNIVCGFLFIKER